MCMCGGGGNTKNQTYTIQLIFVRFSNPCKFVDSMQRLLFSIYSIFFYVAICMAIILISPLRRKTEDDVYILLHSK